MGRRNADELTEGFAFGRCAVEQILDAAQAGHHRVEGPAQAGAGTHAQQIFSTGVQVDERAVRFDNQDGGCKAGKDVGRQRGAAGSGG